MSRRTFLRRGAAIPAAALAGRGVYSLLDDLAAPQRALAATKVTRHQEQYLIDSLEVIIDNSTPVIIPPIFNDVFTAKLAPGTWTKTALVAAQKRLESALSRVESPYPATAAGLTIVVAWGLPYFNKYVPGPWQAKAPQDTELPWVNGKPQLAVLDAVPFPSDPAGVVLETNDVAFKIRSDSSDILQSVETQLFVDSSSAAYVGDLLQLTSKRVGFAGRGFDKVSEAKKKALALNPPPPGASSIPDRAQLTMGFTSTQPAALGPDNIVSFETLPGITNQFPSGYFAHGCAMHLSHMYLHLDTWYGRSYGERVGRMFSPTRTVPPEGTVTLSNGPGDVATLNSVKADAANQLPAGHNSLLQTATRLTKNVTDNYGRVRTTGTAVPVREDFNTLDAPFFWWLDDTGTSHQPLANQPGLHFAVFVPSSNRFHIARRAMDGLLPDGTDLRAAYGNDDAKIGINSAMQATHRQNYLVPPRAHRSFPLAELL